MANRKSTPPTTPTDSLVEQKIVQFAEQMGRIVGTMRAKTDGLVDLQTLGEQLSSIRDGAADLLAHIGQGASEAAAAAPVAKTRPRRARASVDAPGKRHRKPAPSVRGVKHSDTRIAKAQLAKTRRPPRRG